MNLSLYGILFGLGVIVILAMAAMFVGRLLRSGGAVKPLLGLLFLVMFLALVLIHTGLHLFR